VHKALLQNPTMGILQFYLSSIFDDSAILYYFFGPVKAPN